MFEQKCNSRHVCLASSPLRAVEGLPGLLKEINPEAARRSCQWSGGARCGGMPDLRLLLPQKVHGKVWFMLDMMI